MKPNMIYDGMWDHLAGRSFLLDYFGRKQEKHDGWADQADLMIDASITKEYYRQFLQYVGQEEVYTQLVQPMATSIVTLFTPDFSEMARCMEPDSLFQVLECTLWDYPPENTGQATFCQKAMLFEKLITTLFSQPLNAEQLQGLRGQPDLLPLLEKKAEYLRDLLRLWQNTIRPSATKLIGVLQNQFEDMAKEKSSDYLFSLLERESLLHCQGTDDKTIIQHIIEAEIDPEVEYSLLGQSRHTNDPHFQQIVDVLLNSEVIEQACKLCSHHARCEILGRVLDKLGCRQQKAVSELIRFYFLGELSKEEYDRIMRLAAGIKFDLPHEIIDDTSDRESLLDDIFVTKAAEFRTSNKIRKAIQSIEKGFAVKNVRQGLQDAYKKQNAECRKVNNVGSLVRQSNRTSRSSEESGEDLDQWAHLDKFVSVEIDDSFIDAEIESRIMDNFNKKRPILTEKFGERTVHFMSIRLQRNDEKVRHKDIAELWDCDIKKVEYIARKIRKKRPEIEKILDIEKILNIKPT